MSDLDELYSLKWFRNRVKSKKGPHVSSYHLANLIHEEIRPLDCIDLGAGTCSFANRMGELGVPTVAVDGSDFNAEFATTCSYIGADLRKPFNCGKFDLVTSWDVIEHIPAESEETIVRTVLDLSKRVVLLSIDASSWGRGHVNCRAKGYWRRRFEEAGLLFDRNLTDHLAHRIDMDDRITSKWYARNLSAYKVA
jgi:hypothetical protein